MKHRALSMLLALLMVVSLLPIAAVAGDTITPSEDTMAEIKSKVDEQDTVVLRENWNDENTNTLTIDKNNNQNECNLSDLYYEEGKTLLSLFANVDTNGENLICGYLLDTPDGNTAWTAVGKVVYHPGTNGGDKVVMLENIGELTTGSNYLIMVKSGENWYKHYVTVTDDSQQGGNGGNGEGSQLPTVDKENGATVLRLGTESDAATVYMAYQSEVLVLPTLYYTKDDEVINATEELFQEIDNVKCYAIQKNSDGRTLFGNLMLRPSNESNGGNLILWNGLPEDWSGVDSASYVLMFQYGNQWYKLDAQLHAGSAPLVGELVLQCEGNNYFDEDMIELAAGTNEVSLMARDEDNWEMISSKTGLSVDGKVVIGLEPFERTTGEGNTITLWNMILAEPEIGSTATGWIKFVDKNGNASQITIKSLSAHGRKVEDSDKVAAKFDDDWNFTVELDGKTYQGKVAKFNWPEGSSNEYYLAACEWRDKLLDISPKDYGDRAFMHGSNDHMYISARVFQRVAGESGEDVKYILNEDVRAQMVKDGYTFNIVPHPVDGNVNYPTQETVEMVSLSSQSEDVQLDWEHLYYGDPSTAGWWAYEAQLVKGTGKDAEVVARCFSSEQYLKMQEAPSKTLTLDKDSEDNDATQINKQIADWLAHYEPQKEAYIKQMVEFTLPAGTIEGLIIIPKTDCFVNLAGAGDNQGVISTTIKGGVELEGASCDFSSICFIGAGKDEKTFKDGSPNAAAYGYGEGLPRGCILKDYYCAISSEDRSSWAANQSVFINNHIGIRMSALGGGNLRMENNWFVGNDTALLVDESIGADLMESSCNRFVNNEVDLENNSGKTMWMSQNFFYHDYDETNGWTPVLWSGEIGNGILNFYRDDEGRICTSNLAPKFETANNYNALSDDGDPQYLDFLPWFAGDNKTLAYPLARTQECNTFFYPNWKSNVYSSSDPYYPSYVQQGVTISEDELDGLRFSSYDSASDTAVGTFEFSASAAETEN